MAVDIRIASAWKRLKPENADEIVNLVTPGDVITSDTGFMRYLIYNECLSIHRTN